MFEFFNRFSSQIIQPGIKRNFFAFRKGCSDFFKNFDEISGSTAVDSIDGNDGTLINGVVRNPGVAGTAADFNGVDPGLVEDWLTVEGVAADITEAGDYMGYPPVEMPRFARIQRAMLPHKIEIPEGWEGQVRPRSGLALRHGLALVNSPGTIDSDYRGEVMVVLANLGGEPFTIRRGDRIAQLVVAHTGFPVKQKITDIAV